MASSPIPHIFIIGGGIAGLSVAHELRNYADLGYLKILSISETIFFDYFSNFLDLFLKLSPSVDGEGFFACVSTASL